MAEEEEQALGTAGELLAERRARRATESAEAASGRRAEAAEATVRTLEAHLAILRRRLEEAAEDESNQPAPEPRLVIEPGPSGIRPRDDADRQRLAAESRWLELDRRNRAEIERLSRRLSDSDRHTRGLAQRLRDVQRELTASECRLERMRRGHRRLEGLLQETRAVTGQLRAMIGEASGDAAPERFETQLNEARIRAYRLGSGDRAREGKPTAEASAAVVAADAARDPRAGELDAALAVAVERLRARAAGGARPESTAESGPPEKAGAPVSMSPSREPLLATPKPSWWAAWRARRCARRRR